jgi:hypothetical protein
MSGQLVTTAEQIEQLVQACDEAGHMPVALDAWGVPWVLYLTENQDGYAHTVPTDDPDDKPTRTWGQLLDDQPNHRLRVVWDGARLTPVASREQVAEALGHALFGNQASYASMLGISDALLSAGVFRHEAEVRADANHEAAEVQRTLAAASRTRDGKYEHEAIADWLDGRAIEIHPGQPEGAHP